MGSTPDGPRQPQSGWPGAGWLCYLAIELAKHVDPTAVWMEVQVSGTRARWQLEMPLAVACTEKRPTRGIEAIDPHAIGAEVGHDEL